MNKKFLKALLFGGLLFSFTGTFVSCSEDYDDDIKYLQEQIDAQKASIDEIQALLEAGAAINGVEAVAEGIKITINGKDYLITNGKDGQNGQDGAQGPQGEKGEKGESTVWTIGEDGYWYLNGEKTEYKAIGVDGKDGQNGENGKDGEQGPQGPQGEKGPQGEQGPQGPQGPQGDQGPQGEKGDAVYYVPNLETGFFDIYVNGEYKEATKIAWRAQCITAVLSGNKLTLSGLEGTDKDVVLYIGTGLGSIAFIPEVYSNTLAALPTTTEEFYHIATYYQSYHNGATAVFELGVDKKPLKYLAPLALDKSNEVTLKYRLNPTDAFTEGMLVNFINRAVKTRAAGDNKTLLSIAKKEDGKQNVTIANGEVEVNALINVTQSTNPKLTTSTDGKDHDIVALQAWVGQDVVTSDYVYVTSNEVFPQIVNPVEWAAAKKSNNFDKVKYQDRKYAKTIHIAGLENEEKETDAFVKTYIPWAVTPHHNFNYKSTIDLREYVNTVGYTEGQTIDEALPLNGEKYNLGEVTYVFTLPAVYNCDDQNEQNQITNEQVFVELKEGHLLSVNADYGISAVNRTPVVRVDAFINDNEGVSRLIASSYIKFNITDKPEKLQDIPVKLQESILEYTELTATPGKMIHELGFDYINQNIYKAAGFNSVSFWNNYDEATIDVAFTDANNNPVSFSKKEIDVEINANKNTTMTSAIRFFVTNEIKTTKTKDAGVYNVTITIKPKSELEGYLANVVITKKITVNHTCKPFALNTVYKLDERTVEIKGQDVNGWEMSAEIGEHFAIIDGKNILTYYKNHKNTKDLKFEVVPEIINNAPVYYATIDANNVIKYNGLMKDEKKKVTVKYTIGLVNGESCVFDYDVVFVNPFMAGESIGFEIPDLSGENTKLLKPGINVVDRAGEDIFTWDGKNLVYSDLARTHYNLKPTTLDDITYAFDDTNKEYTNFISQLNKDKGAKLVVDSKTGVVTWYNGGTSLPNDREFTVNATVELGEVSFIICKIPVKIVAQ